MDIKSTGYIKNFFSNLAGNEAVRYIKSEWELIITKLQQQTKRTFNEHKTIKNGPQFYTDKQTYGQVSSSCVSWAISLKQFLEIGQFFFNFWYSKIFTGNKNCELEMKFSFKLNVGFVFNWFLVIIVAQTDIYVCDEPSGTNPVASAYFLKRNYDVEPANFHVFWPIMKR